MAAIPAAGAPSHLATLLLAKQGDVKFTYVPYKGTQPALVVVGGGHVNLLMDSMISLLPLTRAAGSLRLRRRVNRRDVEGTRPCPPGLQRRAAGAHHAHKATALGVESQKSSSASAIVLAPAWIVASASPRARVRS